MIANGKLATDGHCRLACPIIGEKPTIVQSDAPTTSEADSVPDPCNTILKRIQRNFFALLKPGHSPHLIVILAVRACRRPVSLPGRSARVQYVWAQVSRSPRTVWSTAASLWQESYPS